MNRPNLAWRLVSIGIFPLWVVIFAAIYLHDSFRYIYLLREDGPVEWLTFAFLALAGLIALDIGIQLYRRNRKFHWFFFAFGLFCLVMGFEEISWGQRLFAITPPEYFLGNSDQQEINVHNVLQQKLDFKTKDLAALVLSLYGIVLPLLALNRRVAALLKRVRLVVPPLYLMVGFLTATLMMFDIPSGFEEEIGEFFFGLAFLLFMLHELTVRETYRQPGTVLSASQRRRREFIDRATILTFTLLAFGLHSWQLDAKGFWLPETVHAAAAQAPVGAIALQGWSASTFELPAWSLVLAVWRPMVGATEYALRFLSVLLATVAIPLLWSTAKAVWPSQVGLRNLAALLLATAPALHFYAQDLSTYALVTALSILSLYLTVTLIEQPTRLRLVVWLLVGWALIFSNLFAVTLVFVEAVVLAFALLRDGEERLNRGLMSAALLLALLPAALWLVFAPGMEPALATASTITDLEDWSYLDRLAQIWKDLAFGSVLWQSFHGRLSVVLVPLFLCGAFVLITLQRSGAFGDIRIRQSSLAWLLLGSTTLALLLAIFVLPILPSAALIFVLPPVLLTASAGALYLWSTVRLVGLAAILLALGLALIGLVTYASDDYAKSDYQEMAAFLHVQRAAEDGTLLMAPSQHFLADTYLQDDRPQLVPRVTPSPYWPEQPSPLVPHEVDGQIQEALRAHPALWLVLHDEDSVDPGRFLQPYLTAVAYRDNCIEWRDVELCRYVSPDFVRPAIHQATDLLYEGTLRLTGVSLATDRTSILGTPAILAGLNWSAEAQPAADYKVSLRLLNGAGEPVAQRDDFPIGPLLPPTTWAASDEKPGYMALPLPADLPAGSYALEVVVYDPSDLSVVFYQTAAGDESDAPLVLGTVEIGEEGEIRFLSFR